ncbi:MFS transporter [Ornithinimicrobium sufpigmenti]|uniref:MFS transporter n=1 Tax=Ornithinimicrobium sufpigmenti TaxID=2508882 RepID=UPI001035D336|nr:MULTISPECIES: MFS transporter [unclassified Ornithinimicrobium]
MNRPDPAQPASARAGAPDLPRTSVWAVPGMIALAVVAFTGFSGYAALLPAAPLWVVREGTSDSAGAGAVNFVLLAATVATQFAVPWIIRRAGWGPVLAAGMVLLGAPSLLHGFTADLAPTLALSAVRGVGFGILTVAASAAAVLLVEPRRRGAAVGAYSLALSVPNVLLMPSGGWIGDTWGFWPVFLLGAVPLVGIPACFALARHLPERSTHAPDHHEAADAPAGRATYLRLIPPSLILLTVTLAGGAIITFAPQLVAVPWLSAVGLFAFGLTSTLTRWRIGAFSDRVGVDRLLWPFVILIVLGLSALAWVVRTPVGTEQVAAWVAACAVVGISYGALQNLTMLQAFAAAGPRRVGAASAVWNAGFDTGTGTGALLVGAVALGAGFGPAMALTAALCLLTLPWALRSARTRRAS